MRRHAEVDSDRGAAQDTPRRREEILEARVGEADTELEVGAASADEIPALAAIWAELMELHERTDHRFALANDARQRWEAMAEEMVSRQQGFLFAARLAGRPVGFCVGWIARNPPIYRVAEVGFISEIAVCRSEQRRGIGRALVLAATRFFASQGVDEFQLSSAVWNEGARRFWETLGGESLLVRYRFPLDHPRLRGGGSTDDRSR
jgi:ribosomal protein S18 acetylase RimI-like enzyme